MRYLLALEHRECQTPRDAPESAMPTYEYACKACGHTFEIVQSFSEDSLTTCPDCAQDELRKVYNAAGIIFKGDGWHIKDYKSSSSSTTAEPPAAADSSSKSETKGDTSSKDGSSSSKNAGKGDSAVKPAAS